MVSILETSEPVRLALIGAGRWGRIYLRALAAEASIILTAVASGNHETTHLVPAGCKLFSDWHTMLAAGGFDGVIIATPPATHAKIAQAAMEKGLAVLIEKPLTLDHLEALRIREIAAGRPTICRVGHIHLYAPAWRRLKQIVREIAPLRKIRTAAGNHGPYRLDTSVLWDWGPHDIAMCLDLLGTAPDQAEAHLVARKAVHGGLAERLRLRLRFGRLEANIVVGTDMNKTRQFEALCAGGTVLYDDLAPAKLTLNGVAVEIDPTPPLTVQIRDFAEAIRVGSVDLSDLDLGVTVVAVLDRCQAQLALEGVDIRDSRRL